MSRLTLANFVELVRYYQAAAVNAIFGFSLYAVFVALGLNIYVAQILAHCLGVLFNYFTYSRHAFKGAAPAKTRFAATYVVNYLLGLASLAAISTVVKSPYLAGALALVLTSAINYFALRYLVFRRRAAQ